MFLLCKEGTEETLTIFHMELQQCGKQSRNFLSRFARPRRRAGFQIGSPDELTR